MVLSTPLRFLALLPKELSLATVLKSGQSFRWHRFDTVHATQLDPSSDISDREDVGSSSGEEWAMGWGDRTVVLRQSSTGIFYRSLYSFTAPHTDYLADLKQNTTLPLLMSYFQLDTPLTPLYAEWGQMDSNFRKKMEKAGTSLEGIRVLKQDPWETLISFICSANNNISRITLMVNRLCERLGSPLPHPSSFHPSTVHPTPLTVPNSEVYSTVPSSSQLSFSTSMSSKPPSLNMYAFPPPKSLTPASTDLLLRELGFGYRAPYILATSLILLKLAEEKKITAYEYLEGLTWDKFVMKDSLLVCKKEETDESSSIKTVSDEVEEALEQVREELMKFKGVGRKVADCVALFGLGWKQVVPVDTHVFQIAIRDYGFPSSKATSLTPVLHNKVAAKLREIWGTHAGWAQQVLFFADLASTKSATASAAATSSSLSPSDMTSSDSSKKRTMYFEYEEIPLKAKWETDVEELMRTPQKRRRTTTMVHKAISSSVATKSIVVEELVKMSHHVKVEKDLHDEDDLPISIAYPSPVSISGSGMKKIKYVQRRKR